MQDLKTYTTEEVAIILGLSPRYLRKLRSLGGGPEFIRLSQRRCVYTEASLREWQKKRLLKSNKDDRHERPDSTRYLRQVQKAANS